jgi:invasion protein IalB
MKAISLVGLVSAALSVGAAAFAQPSAPAPAPATAPTFQGFGDTDKTCLAWTDQCRSCRREADNTVTCSNIGIACQPAEITCTARPEPGK